MTRRCSRCKKTLPVDQFGFVSRTQRLKSWCNPCSAAYAVKYRAAGRMRGPRLKHSYGISENEYQQMLDTQNGCCAICKRIETRVGRTGAVLPLCVDHNHTTGDIRGLLCSSCNQGLGFMQDDPDRFRAAANYLEGNKDLRG